MNFLKYFLTAGLVFVVLDTIWITVVAKKFYYSQIGHLLAEKADLRPAVLFYIIYIAAIIVFAVMPALHLHSLSYAIKYAAFLGFAMYATYDLTNQATLKNWPTAMTLVDMAWGTFATTSVGTLTYLIFSRV